ncbi:alcohol dehydrogenase [Parafrankia colletiae]|uniref:Alcohol dehydrogenase n=1 Tax=Parafrankia colletiae TaxID=573497 RepID=A0A1S1QW87_9ACTN|nr:alcohol dehydrogenase [Parafrankia colletiae]
MRAFVCDRFGPPDSLRLAEVPRPTPGPGEVLVRVHATSVNPYDWHHLRGQPYLARVMGGGVGLRRPRFPILGTDVAGQVEALGPGVTGPGPGDEVFALLSHGGFAEYVCVRADELAPKPVNLSFAQAAAVPMAACTALLAVRDQGRLQAGQRVLVNGASGGVGTFAVQLARAFGAEVTGVCSTRNTKLVSSLGASEVVDYTTADFTRAEQPYELLIDNAGSRPAAACRRVLTRGGTFVAVGGHAGRWVQPAGHVFAAVAQSPFVPQRMVMVEIGRCTGAENRANLVTLTRLLESGEVTPVIDRTYPFEEMPTAVAYQEEGHAPGKVVLTIR